LFRTLRTIPPSRPNKVIIVQVTAPWVANLAVFWLKLNLFKARYNRKSKRKSVKLYLNDSEIRSFGIILVILVNLAQFLATFEVNLADLIIQIGNTDCAMYMSSEIEKSI